MHLRQIRTKVDHLPASSEHWPDHILRMRKQDVVILFDFRRYQPDLAKLAAIIREKRKSSIVLITDKWMSPIARDSDHVVALPIEVGHGMGHGGLRDRLCRSADREGFGGGLARHPERIEAWDAVRSAPTGQDEGGKSDDSVKK